MVLLLIGLSLWVGWALSAPAYANPGILYAAPSAQGSGDCSSWANACTLQTALANATSGDEIWVKKGVHHPGTTRDDSFTLKDGVALYGGFAGTETQRSQRNWQANVVVLSGDIDHNDSVDADGVVTSTANIHGSNSYHVIYSTDVTSSAILDGFVVTAGQADGTMFQGYGGGDVRQSHQPDAAQCHFSGNMAAQQGGGMWHSKCDMTLVNVTFRNNSAAQGGGMYNLSCEPTLTDVTFSGNTATGDGGGMLNDNSDPMLNRVTFRSNTAGYNGGGMHNYYSNPTVINALFSGNAATGSGSTGLGGGMFNFQSSPTLVNVTFGGNTATQGGGGMYNYDSNNLNLTNVIIWHNSTPDIGNDGVSRPTIAYSDIRGCGGSAAWDSDCGTNGGGNIDADPRFVNLVGGNLRLQPGSPCIDAGNNAALPAGITTDLDGNPRIVDGNRDGTPVVDMGAYEGRYRYCYLPVVRK